MVTAYEVVQQILKISIVRGRLVDVSCCVCRRFWFFFCIFLVSRTFAVVPKWTKRATCVCQPLAYSLWLNYKSRARQAQRQKMENYLFVTLRAIHTRTRSHTHTRTDADANTQPLNNDVFRKAAAAAVSVAVVVKSLSLSLIFFSCLLWLLVSFWRLFELRNGMKWNEMEKKKWKKKLKPKNQCQTNEARTYSARYELRVHTMCVRVRTSDRGSSSSSSGDGDGDDWRCT